MNQRALIAAAAASLLSSMLVAAPAVAQEKEKCYGIATAGQNDCANLSGSHSCAGQSKVSADVNEWKYVAKGTCASMKGLTAAQAKEKVKMMTDKKS
ncbi:MAG: BufA1 family periplasmic bufferin-type metallophore [Polaromonas sp.]